VRVYDTHRLEARCRCSRERIEGILRLFSQSELREMCEEGVTTVTCEFCNQRYVFDAADLERLMPA
jgi:molecular chaperone Hsp33